MTPDLSKCVKCGQPAMIGVLYNATDAYVHYCLSHEPKGKELQPVLDEADIDD